MPVVAKMPKTHFDSVIRSLKKSQIDRVEQIRKACFRKMKELGVERNTDLAVSGVPKGSDQLNVKSVIDWINKLTPKDKRAIRQLVRIDATAVVRMNS